ncbi:TPA: DUF2986 domain-containing protein, partial [Vibrio cholerae O1]
KLAAKQEANPELGTSDAKPTEPSLSNSALQ